MIPLTVEIHSPEIKSAEAKSLSSSGSQSSTRGSSKPGPTMPRKVNSNTLPQQEMIPLTIDVHSPEIKSADKSLSSSGIQINTRGGRGIMPSKVIITVHIGRRA